MPQAFESRGGQISLINVACVHFSWASFTFRLLFFSFLSELLSLSVLWMQMVTKTKKKKKSTFFILYLFSCLHGSNAVTCINFALIFTILYIFQVVYMYNFESIIQWISYPCKPVKCNDMHADCLQRLQRSPWMHIDASSTLFFALTVSFFPPSIELQFFFSFLQWFIFLSFCPQH